jgi:GNAT superfamily N-acetyltransferase
MLIRPATEVSPELLGAALHEIAGRDLMVAPVDAARVYDAATLVALEGEAIAGVGWRVRGAWGVRVDIRVHPSKRRTGVGTALLEALCGDEPGPVLASCDAGHPRARRFVEHRGFELVGIVFFQRWDGVPADVPGAFRSAELRPVSDAEAAMTMLTEASADSWPPPVVDAQQLADPAQFTRVAWLDGQRVGLVTARLVGDAWVTGGFAVLPTYRKRGVGRGLLASLMRAGAKDGQGVVLRVHHEAALVQAWTATLGFWTYRSWAHYARAGAE